MSNKPKTEPIYHFDEKDQSFTLANGTVKLNINKKEYTAEGLAKLKLLPFPNICFIIHSNLIPLEERFQIVLSFNEIESFYFNDNIVSARQINAEEIDESLHLRFIPKSEPLTIRGNERTKINKAVFNLFNFSNPTSIIEISFDEWKITLSPTEKIKEHIDFLDINGGFRITHVGQIEKSDNKDFLSTELENLINAIGYLFSFHRGMLCYPVCIVGYDSTETKVWESWSSPREGWKNCYRWTTDTHSTDLLLISNHFLHTWFSRDWGQTLQQAIYWYVQANSQCIETGIILTQAAIERLSYQFSVKERKLITVNGFKSLTASDKFRILFSSLSISIEIPEETISLKSKRWTDAPHALTEIRNSIIHPEHKNNGKVDDIMQEAWHLGLWYLELSILGICGYNGRYANRLKDKIWFGDTDKVPWAETN